eukprot:scaffold2286_cov240-Pinguiococcus_pyrenoidosus.AAC.11
MLGENPHRGLAHVHVSEDLAHRRADRAELVNVEAEEVNVPESVPSLLLAGEQPARAVPIHRSFGPGHIEEREQIHALPGIPLAVHVHLEVVRVELLDRRRRRRHQLAVASREQLLASGRQAAQELQERRQRAGQLKEVLRTVRAGQVPLQAFQVTEKGSVVERIEPAPGDAATVIVR